MKGKFGKRGLLSLALLLALGTMGIGLAHWQDTLTIDTTMSTGRWKDYGGSPGWWKTCSQRYWLLCNCTGDGCEYNRDEVLGFLAGISGSSSWLSGVTTISQMYIVLTAGQGGTMAEKFLRQYLATRLNLAAGRLIPTNFHVFTTYDPPTAAYPFGYLGLNGQGTLQEIINRIESKFDTSPTSEQLQRITKICEALNDVEI